jgi:hypothetical protein
LTQNFAAISGKGAYKKNIHKKGEIDLTPKPFRKEMRLSAHQFTWKVDFVE